MEVSMSMDQGHPDKWQAEIGRRSDSVAGEYPQAAGIRRHMRVYADLHREVGDHP
jgi:hypothetical protein